MARHRKGHNKTHHSHRSSPATLFPSSLVPVEIKKNIEQSLIQPSNPSPIEDFNEAISKSESPHPQDTLPLGVETGIELYVPVHLARTEIQINVAPEITINSPHITIIDVKWEIDSLTYHLANDMRTLMLKGIFHVKVDYHQNDLSKQVNPLLKASKYIPWTKSVNVQLQPPGLKVINQKSNVYTFMENQIAEGIVYREQLEPQNVEPHYSLYAYHIVSSEQIYPSDDASILLLLANVTLTVDILQNQYINL